MKFLLQYLVVAALLAVGIWHGIPAIKASQATAPASGEPSVGPSAKTLVPEAVTSAPTTTASAPAAVPAPAAAPVPGDRTAESSATAPEPAARPAPVAPIVQVSSPTAPEEQVQQPGYTGPRYDWGVLAEEAQSYGTDGKIRVKLPAGTVVEKIEEKNSSGGRMAVCRILVVTSRGSKRWENGYVLKSSSLVMFAGPFAEAPKAPSDKIVRYFQLQGLIDARTAVLREEHLKKNPYFSSYQQAANAYTEFQDKAKALTAQRDAAQGMAKTRLSQDLERMKGEEPRLRAALEKAQIPYKKWKDENGDGYDTVMNDEQIAKWDAEKQDLRAEIREMVPGI